MSLPAKSLSLSTTRLSAQQIEELELKLVENPYFLKFKDRIAELRVNDPNTYVQRLQLMLDTHEKQQKKDAGIIFYKHNFLTPFFRRVQTYVENLTP